MCVYICIYICVCMYMCVYIYYCTLGSGVHVQNMQNCCIGMYMAMWFAASIPCHLYLSFLPMLSLPNLPALPYSLPNRPQCVMLPSLCPSVLIVQHPSMSENMQCLIFCSCVSLLRMTFSRFIHVPTNDTNSSFLIAA